MRKQSHSATEVQANRAIIELPELQNVAEALSLLSEDARNAIFNNLHAFFEIRGAKFAQAPDGSAVGTGHGQIFVEVIFDTEKILAAARGASNR